MSALGMALHELGQILTRTGDLQITVDRAVQAAVEALRSDAGLVCLFDADRGHLAVLAAHGYGGDVLRIVARPDRGGAPAVVFQAHQPQIWSSGSDIDSLIHSLEPAERRLLRNARQGLGPPTSLLCTPCVARGLLVGCVQLERGRDAHPFVLADLALAQAFANQLAPLLDEILLVRKCRQREAVLTDLLCRVLEQQASGWRRLTSELAEAAGGALAALDGPVAERGEVALSLAAGGEHRLAAERARLMNLRRELHCRLEGPSSRAQALPGPDAVRESVVWTATSPAPAMMVAPTGRLTRRETEVTRLIAEGRTNREIAEHLAISVRTVQTHRRHILDKLGVHECSGVVRYAIREGLILP